MNKEEFIVIVESIIQSLKENPNQFHVNIIINTTGLSVESSGMSTGISSTVYGGTGINVKAEIGKRDVEITQAIATQEFQERLDKLIEALEKIRAEATKNKPDKNVMSGIINELKLIAPALVCSILTKLLELLFRT